MGAVILLGGYVFDRVAEGELHLLKQLRDSLTRSNDRIAIVAGGGKVARKYISIIDRLGGNNYLKDEVGILATRINAQLVVAALGEIAFPKVVRSYDEALEAFSLGLIPVSGGMTPAQSTDAVASIMAERLSLDLLVKVTATDGIYEKDPIKYQDSTRYDRLTYDQFEEILMRQRYEPGRYELFDLLALKVIKRSKIRLIITKGDRLDKLSELLDGDPKGLGSLVEGG